MMKFQNFINNEFKKKFVSLFFTSDSCNQLREWCTSNGFDITYSYSGNKISAYDFDFHTTVFFTTSEHDTKNGTFSIDNLELSFSSFELLGKDNNIPVLKIDTNNEKLMSLRHKFEQMGYKDEWPSYKPHITLSYNYNGEPDISKLVLPKIKIIANRIKIENQNG